MKLGISVGIAMAVTASLVARQGPPAALAPAPESAKEVHLSNVRQLTFGGENAEAYFSSDGKQLIFQSTRDGGECDQIYTMRPTDRQRAPRQHRQGAHHLLVLLRPTSEHVLYASTHLGGKACPPRPDFSRGYVWALYDTYDIFKANADGTGITPAHHDARLRRRGHHRARRPHRLHQRARRRHGALLDGRRRRRRQAAHHRVGPDGGAVLLARRHADRLPRPHPDARARARRLQDAARDGLVASDRRSRSG